jgi:hypothetical protein
VLRGSMSFRGSELLSLGVSVSARSDILLYHSLILWSYSTFMNLSCALISYLFDFVSSC